MSSSRSVSPRAHTSARASASRVLRNCSGAMFAGGANHLARGRGASFPRERRGLIAIREIEDLHQTGAVESARLEQVRGLDVTVNDSRSMRLLERFGHCFHNTVYGLHERERSVFGQSFGERTSGQVLHDDEGRPLFQCPDVEDPHGMLTPEAGTRASFTEQSLPSWARGEARRRELDGNTRAEDLVRGRYHYAHPTGADEPLNLVFSSNKVAGPYRRCRGAFDGRGRRRIEGGGHAEAGAARELRDERPALATLRDVSRSR